MADIKGWIDKHLSFDLGTSGVVDCYYFQSLYFRTPGGITGVFYARRRWS